MKTSECIRHEDWGAFDAWGADDPRRVHVNQCARCQAQHLAYREMLEDQSVPPGARPREAALAMRRALEAELHPAGSRAAHRGWREIFFARPLFAGAAAVAAAVMVWFALSPQGLRHEEGALRGSEEPAPRSMVASVTVGSGFAELSWSAVPAANAYAVVFFDSDLREIHRIGPMDASTTTARVDLGEPPLAAARPLYWQVVASSGDNDVASSPVRRLDLGRL